MTRVWPANRAEGRWLGALLVVASVACGSAEDAPVVESEAVSAQPSKPTRIPKSMEGALRQLRVAHSRTIEPSVREKHMAKAIDEYIVVTDEIQADFAKMHIKGGRVGVRPRKPGPAAPEWVKQYMGAIANKPKEQVERYAMKQDETLRMAEPLYAGALCLTCHGPADQLLEEAATALRQKFPEDKALSFAQDELLGVVWVEGPAY